MIDVSKWIFQTPPDRDHPVPCLTHLHTDRGPVEVVVTIATKDATVAIEWVIYLVIAPMLDTGKLKCYAV